MESPAPPSRAFEADLAGSQLLSPPPRPQDAASLVLVRARRNGFEVLMGRRPHEMAFMPNKWVFPGGRVDLEDARAPAKTELSAEDTRRLRRPHVRRSARAFALAAVRETFEETGLVIGAPCRQADAFRGWSAYAQLGAAPELHKMRFLARAITPPQRTRRFDARFFLALAEDCLLDDRPLAGEELVDLTWTPLADAAKLDVPAITHFVLAETQARLAAPDRRPAFVRMAQGREWVERL